MYEKIYGVLCRNQGMFGFESMMNHRDADGERKALYFTNKDEAHKYVEGVRESQGGVNNFNSYFVKEQEIDVDNDSYLIVNSVEELDRITEAYTVKEEEKAKEMSNDTDGVEVEKQEIEIVSDKPKNIPYFKLYPNLKKKVNGSFDDRIEMAEKHFGLDKLVNDENFAVRCTVAEAGYGLDKLASDPHSFVRCAVARQDSNLDKLVDDASFSVRVQVVEQNYGYDKLINDDEPIDVINGEPYTIGDYVKTNLKNQGLTLDEWMKKNPDRCALAENQPKKQVRVKVATQDFSDDSNPQAELGV